MNEVKIIINDKNTVFRNSKDVLLLLSDPRAYVVNQVRKIINIFNEDRGTSLNIWDLKKNFDIDKCAKTSDNKLHSIIRFLQFFKEYIYINLVFREIRWNTTYKSLINWDWWSLENVEEYSDDIETILASISEFIDVIINNIDNVVAIRNNESEKREKLINSSWKILSDKSNEKWKELIYNNLINLKDNPDKLREILIILYNRVINWNTNYTLTRSRSGKKCIDIDTEFMFINTFIKFLYAGTILDNKALKNNVKSFLKWDSNIVTDHFLKKVADKIYTKSMNFDHLFWEV